MKITQNKYEVLERSVANIYETADLAESLRESARKDDELAAVMRDFFSDDEEQCADFVRQNSIVRTSIVASVQVRSAELTASFDSDEEMTEDDAREFVHDNFSFAYVDTHDYAEIDVEDVDLNFSYRMNDFAEVSRTA